MDVTVKEDNTDKIERYYETARAAIDGGDYEEALDCYSWLRKECPNDWEALFFSLYCKVAQCRIMDIVASANLLKDNYDNIFKLINNISDSDEKVRAAKLVCEYSTNILDCLFSSAKSHFNECFSANANNTKLTQDTTARYSNVCWALFQCGASLYFNVINNDARKHMLTPIKKALELYDCNKAVSPCVTLKLDYIDSVIELAGKVDPEFMKNRLEKDLKSQKSVLIAAIIMLIAGPALTVWGVFVSFISFQFMFGIALTLMGLGFTAGASSNIKKIKAKIENAK